MQIGAVDKNRFGDILFINPERALYEQVHVTLGDQSNRFIDYLAIVIVMLFVLLVINVTRG